MLTEIAFSLIHSFFFLCRKADLFPDENLPNRLFNGVRYADLPICHIKASPNNTIINLTNADGQYYLLQFIFLARVINHFFVHFQVNVK